MSDGRHLILDMYGCSKIVLDDRQLLVQALESALRMQSQRFADHQYK